MVEYSHRVILMKNKRKIIVIAIIILFAIIFIGTCLYIVFKGIDGIKAKNEYNKIASSYAVGMSNSEGNTGITTPSDIDTNIADNPVDFDTLTKQNPDIYSWIYIPNTNINYPVCQSAVDDNFYLDHDIYMNYSYPGAIYSQICNKKDYSDRVTVLYGHNMADGSMFADLHKFENSEFFSKNKNIFVYTKGHKLTYVIVSAFVYDDRHIMNSFDFSDDKVFSDYLEMIENPRSVSKNVREGLELTVDDKMIVLSTCLNSGNGRYLVQGVLVNDEKTE